MVSKINQFHRRSTTFLNTMKWNNNNNNHNTHHQRSSSTSTGKESSKRSDQDSTSSVGSFTTTTTTTTTKSDADTGPSPSPPLKRFPPRLHSSTYLVRYPQLAPQSVKFVIKMKQMDPNSQLDAVQLLDLFNTKLGISYENEELFDCVERTQRLDQFNIVLYAKQLPGRTIERCFRNPCLFYNKQIFLEHSSLWTTIVIPKVKLYSPNASHQRDLQEVIEEFKKYGIGVIQLSWSKNDKQVKQMDECNAIVTLSSSQYLYRLVTAVSEGPLVREYQQLSLFGQRYGWHYIPTIVNEMDQVWFEGLDRYEILDTLPPLANKDRGGTNHLTFLCDICERHCCICDDEPFMHKRRRLS